MGKETLPLSVLLMNHCFRTSLSTAQALPAALASVPFTEWYQESWRLPAVSLLPSPGPSSFSCRSEEWLYATTEKTRPLEGQESKESKPLRHKT